MPRLEKRHTKESRDKELLSLYAEYNKTSEKLRQSIVKIPLDPPRRRGWEKVLILREDIAKSDEAKVYLGILPFIFKNPIVSYEDKEFLYLDIKTKQYKVKRAVTSYVEPKVWDSEVKNRLTLKQQSLFELKRVRFQSWRDSIYRKVMVFTKPWVFVEYLQPHYEYFDIVVDQVLQKAYDHLHKLIWSNTENYNRLKHLKGWNWDRNDDWYIPHRIVLLDHLESEQALIKDHYQDQEIVLDN